MGLDDEDDNTDVEPAGEAKAVLGPPGVKGTWLLAGSSLSITPRAEATVSICMASSLGRRGLVVTGWLKCYITLFL